MLSGIPGDTCANAVNLNLIKSCKNGINYYFNFFLLRFKPGCTLIEEVHSVYKCIKGDKGS